MAHTQGEMSLREILEKILPLVKGKKIIVKDYIQLSSLEDTFKRNGNFHFIQSGTPYFTALFDPIPMCSYHQQSIYPKISTERNCAMRHAVILKRNITNLYEKVLSHSKP